MSIHIEAGMVPGEIRGDDKMNLELANRIRETAAGRKARAGVLLDRGPHYMRAPALDRLAKSLRDDAAAAKKFWQIYFEPIHFCPVSRTKIKELTPEAQAALYSADEAEELLHKAEIMAKESWGMKASSVLD